MQFSSRRVGARLPLLSAHFKRTTMNLQRTASMTTFLVTEAILSPKRVNYATARPARPMSKKSDNNESNGVLSISGLFPIVLRGENFQEIPAIPRFSVDFRHSLGVPSHKRTLSQSNEIPRGRDRNYRSMRCETLRRQKDCELLPFNSQWSVFYDVIADQPVGKPKKTKKIPHIYKFPTSCATSATHIQRRCSFGIFRKFSCSLTIHLQFRKLSKLTRLQPTFQKTSTKGKSTPSINGSGATISTPRDNPKLPRKPDHRSSWWVTNFSDKTCFCNEFSMQSFMFIRMFYLQSSMTWWFLWNSDLALNLCILMYF